MSVLANLSGLVRRSFSLKKNGQWPLTRGDYRIVDATAPVVVAGVAQDLAAKELVGSAPKGLCMVAALHTATDVGNLIRALATNLAVEFVICTSDRKSKQPLCDALLLLGRGDETPSGPVGQLMNAAVARIDPVDLKTVRRRVEFVDLLGCTDTRKIAAKVEESATAANQPNAGFVAQPTADGVERLVVPRDVRYEARRDKAGDFRIRIEEHSIVVEHVNAKDRVLRLIEGKTARDLCLAVIRNGWVSRLDHAAYLGRELARAELAMRNGQRFVPDSAEPAPVLRPTAGED